MTNEGKRDRYKGPIEAMSKEPEDPAKTVYKDLVEPPLPPTFTTSELVGSYSDPAWGKLTFREEPDDRKAGETVLVADRPDMTWRWQMRISHASGDFWVARMSTTLSPTLQKEYLPARFNRGPDGKVSELVVEWVNAQNGVVRCKGLFRRME